LYGELSGLPSAIIVTAEFDPLRDEDEAYGKALEAAGVRADVRRYAGMIHGFFDMGAVSPAAQAAIEECCERFGTFISPSPLAAREFETGTFRLAWTQGITRTRWLAVKLGVVGAASMAVAGFCFWWIRRGRSAGLNIRRPRSAEKHASGCRQDSDPAVRRGTDSGRGRK